MNSRASPWWFLAWVGAVSIPIFVLGAVRDGIGVGAMRLPASAVIVIVPGAVAAALCWRAGGRPAVRQLASRLVDRPHARWRWYLLGAGVFAVGAVLAQTVAAMRGAGSELPLPLAAAPVVILVFVVAAVAEELGWSGYATAPLLTRIGVVGTGAVLGVFWALWHLIPLAQAGHPWLWMASWFVNTVAARMLIVAVYDRTAGAVGTAVTAHAALNLTQAYTPALDAPATMVIMAAVTSVCAAALLTSKLAARRVR